MNRPTLTLKKPADPRKIALSLHLGYRYIDRKGRYILQAHVMVGFDQISCDGDRTWIDVPLCPETYGEAQA